jgi:hypothetical protein
VVVPDPSSIQAVPFVADARTCLQVFLAEIELSFELTHPYDSKYQEEYEHDNRYIENIRKTMIERSHSNLEALIPAYNP